MRVFISHSSHDKPAVLALAEALRQRGFDPWVDQWQIVPGQDIVARINAGLAEADAGLIVFSAAAQASHWVQAEWSALTFARIEQGRPLLPITIGGFADIPPLLAPLLRRRIDEHDAIADALRQRGARPASAIQPEAGQAQRVRLRLRALPGGAVHTELRSGDQTLGDQTLAAWPAGLATALGVFQQGFGQGVQRELAAPATGNSDTRMAHLGQLLAALCLPGASGAALQALIDGLALGQRLELAIESADPALLGLPFEALRLPDGRLLATQPGVVMWRSPAGLVAPAQPPLAGPLKLLVAVGAPDEGLTRSAVLDQERELQSILDAVEPQNQLENFQVRILEVGHPGQIAQAFARDAYHVLHLSCHGGPGLLELEDEDGRPVSISPAELLAPLRALGRPLPLVLLNACHGGVAAAAPGPAATAAPEPAPGAPAASFALALLQAGVPAVLAMQTAVTDGYATALARAFYGHLAQGEHLRPSRALALARQQLEAERQQALRAGAATVPEYATAALYIAGEEAPLADFGADRRPLQVRPVHAVAGPVPQLQQDELIGRRPGQRNALRALRAGKDAPPGVLLTGIGGVGKSALAGRLMQRQAEAGALLAVCSGRYGLQASFEAVGAALRDAPGAAAQQLGQRFKQPAIDDAERQRLLHKAMAEQPMLLVLDDFEQNLSAGGERFLDPDVADALAALAAQCQRGRLLVTCRHPLPGGVAGLQRVRVGPLSPAEQRKLVLRLPQLQGLPLAELQPVLGLVGGHPRLMEFVDALLHGGQGRLRHVTAKLQVLMRGEPAAPAAGPGGLAPALNAAQLLAARDVFLNELLALARDQGAEPALLQLAACNLPVSADGLARMLADDPAQQGDLAAANLSITWLEDLSLLHRQADGTAQVHRWTAQGLAAADAAAHRDRCRRAGRYHWWRVGNESHDLADAVEALRNHLAGENFDPALAIAKACFQALTQRRQAVGIAALAAEVLEHLPTTHPGFGFVADTAPSAYLTLGQTQRAFGRYQALLQAQQHRAQAEPDRADYQRDLSVSYTRMAALLQEAGDVEGATAMFAGDLAIARRLALAEPQRADYQRDLVISLLQMGTLPRPEADAELSQAWRLLSDLMASGRLNPSDQGLVDHLRGLMAQRGQPTG